VHAGRAQTPAKFFYNRFRRWIRPNQENSDIFKPSKFEALYQPYFGFWLFVWSRCGQIKKKVAEKIPGTSEQNFSVLSLAAASLYAG